MTAFTWLLKREVWETRSVWFVPGILALLMVGGTLAAVLGLTHVEFNGVGASHDEATAFAAQMTPGKIAVMSSVGLTGLAQPFLLLAVLTQFFYSLGALYTERQDRSILFWKSLPPSDTDTVLSKLCIASVVVPLAALAVAVVAVLLVSILLTFHLRSMPLLTGTFWTFQVWGQALVVMVYAWLVIMVWTLPMVGFNLLISAVSPRSPFMISILLPIGIWFVDARVLGTHWLNAATMSWLRLLVDAYGEHGEGATNIISQEAVTMPGALVEITRPLAFFGSPVLWAGLALTTGHVLGTIWVRRYRAAATG